MPRPSLPAAFAVLLLVLAVPACGGPTKPPDSPETTDKPEATDKPADPADKDPASPPPADDGKVASAPGARKVDPALSLDTYEMTPADCSALGQHYGEVARNDQLATLSPKLKPEQREKTAAQIDKVVGKLEESWTNGCHTTLVNHAVDHDAIKCALAAKTVKDFDVCINGPSGTPQPAQSGKKKK